MLCSEIANETVNMNDGQPLKETHFDTCSYVNDSKVVSAEEEKKPSFKQDIASSTDTVFPVELLSEHSNEQILSMTKLEDIENFMDTLLESKLEGSSSGNSLQNVPHDMELSTAKPPTDIQLMDELFRINEKLSSTSDHSNVDYPSRKDENKNKGAKESESLDPCIGINIIVNTMHSCNISFNSMRFSFLNVENFPCVLV